MTTYSLDALLFLFGTSLFFHVQFFCMWLSNFPNIIYWRDCPFSMIYSWLFCHKLFYIYVGFISGFSLLFQGLCVCFYINTLQFYILCCCSVTQSCPTLCIPTDCSTPGFSVLPYLLEIPQTHVHWVNDAIQPFSFILCHPLLLLPSVFPSIRVFPNESVLRIRWPKYWSFTFSVSPSNERSELISFRIDRVSMWSQVSAFQCSRSQGEWSKYE